jgi:hypothetical protein
MSTNNEEEIKLINNDNLDLSSIAESDSFAEEKKQIKEVENKIKEKDSNVIKKNLTIILGIL